ncbi:hypothetical protein [Actinomadura sp. WMMA1423]|uniref:hypothetical protein n=1 Tax=Actinomadura sp. WMMA1423 TaxID=2591108 RepID=UPI001146801A|nr:hypothetical protein [Actinomadura sp. WMMA1423]
MTKPRKVYKLAERRRERAEAFGGDSYPIEGLDGEIVEIPYMSFWPEQLTKKVYGDDYPGDIEVLRLAISETWPEEPERLEAFERLGLQTGDVVEIITEVLKVAPGAENSDEDDDAAASTAKAKTGKKPSGAGKSRSSSAR